MSLSQAFDKLNSTIFFAFVDRWHVEIDPFLLWLSFAVVILLHWFDFKSIFIKGNSNSVIKNKELVDALLLSYIYSFLWFKIMSSLKATKVYGGFLRYIEICLKKMLFLLVFIFFFIILMTGVFNLLFQQTLQFQNYFDSFFYLIQASQQEYVLGENWNIIAKFVLIIYMGLCTFILINFVISYETNIYQRTENEISSEYRCNLVKLYEYLKWDEKYGLFKFLFAPLNVIQIPFTIFVAIFQDDNIIWTKISTKILYFPICLCYFVFYFIYQTISLVVAMFYVIFIYPLKYRSSNQQLNNIKNVLFHTFLSPFILFLYYLQDFVDFWYYAYKEQVNFNDEKETNSNLLEFQNSFESMIDIIIQKVNSNKNKNFSVNNLIESWKLFALKEIHEKNTKLKPSKFHSILIDKKVGRRNTVGFFQKKLTIEEEARIEHITFNLQKEKNIEFLNRFADEEGFIDKKIAKNLFIKDSYYEDDYLECIYYFRYKYFKDLINYFDKSKDENKSEINKLRGVYIDILKAYEKFKILKNNLEKIELKENQINSMVFGISNINMFFAKMEEHLINEQKKEKKYKTSNKKKAVKLMESNIIIKPDSSKRYNLKIEKEIK
jgi:hypothetical protein